LDLCLTEHKGVQSPSHAVEVADRRLTIVLVEVLLGSANHFARLLGKNSLRRLLCALIPAWTNVEFGTVAGGEEHRLLDLGVGAEPAECHFGLSRGERETFPDFDRSRQVAHANHGDGAQRKKPP
jgi:hypothetical protein